MMHQTDEEYERFTIARAHDIPLDQVDTIDLDKVKAYREANATQEKRLERWLDNHTLALMVSVNDTTEQRALYAGCDSGPRGGARE